MSVEKTCVILGAGASNDIHGAGSFMLDEDFRPPLAIDLFNIEKHPSYWSVMAPYRGAVNLAQDLADKSLSGAFDLEQELRECARHNDKKIQEYFKHIPAYLRDLLFRVSRDYTAVPSSYMRLVKKLLYDYQYDVLFLILNYDNLLESALQHLDPAKFKFTNINHYVAEERNAKVVKLHGSIDWFRRLPSVPDEDWDAIVADFDIFQPLPEHEIIVRDGIPQVREMKHQDYMAYPVLTAPLAGKNLTDAVCPKSHIDAAKQFISGCAKFLIIGTSGLDEDLLELLDTTIDPMQAVLIDIVDWAGGAVDARNRFYTGVRAFKKVQGLTMSNIYKGGFLKYLASEQFQNFITFRM